MDFKDLIDFIDNRMKMSHIYQPLMLRILVEAGGTATIRQIAHGFLAQDESQLRYYENRIKQMPLPVLKNRGVISKEGELVTLNCKKLTFVQKAQVVMSCEKRLQQFIIERGLDLWGYRLLDNDPIPGSLRYRVLKESGDRCALCGATKKERPLDVDHIIPRSRGGETSYENLQILCSLCNQEKGNKTAEEFGHPSVHQKVKKPLRAVAFMNSVRWKIVNALDCEHTYGYITKYNRIKLGLEKSDSNDAFVIAGGTEQERCVQYRGKQVRRQNRSLYKANFLKGGRLKRNTVKEVKGFKRFDKVRFEGKECFIFGLRSSGYFDVRDFDGNKIGASVNCKKLRLIEHAKGIIQEVRAIPPTALVVGFHTRF